MNLKSKVFNIALFGEAEKGDFNTAYYCQNLPQLVDYLGHPPEQSNGLYLAIQALLFHRHIIFFRVREEGFSLPDYLAGFRLLSTLNQISTLAAIGMPGVGDSQIIQAVEPIRDQYHSIILTTEADLFDYLTSYAA